MRAKPIDALVLAGGRIGGEYAAAVGTEVKALAMLGGRASVARVAAALLGTERVERVVVVGPASVQPALPEGCEWQAETDSAYGNVRAGLGLLGPETGDQVLLCGADVPVLTPAALDDFLTRSPSEAHFCLPVVRREHFEARFPGSANRYVRLAEGQFTGGSQYLIQPHAVLENEAILQELVRQRKSQIGMVRTFGLRFIWRLVTGRLTIAQLEARASELTRSRCRAIPDCHAELAFDIDSLADHSYLDRRERPSPAI